MVSLGAQIRVARERKGFTGLALAQRLGVKSSAVTRWEKDVDHPSGKNLAGLARELDIPMEQLLAASAARARDGHTAQIQHSPSARSTLNAPEGAVDDPKFQQTWADLSELYRMQRRRKKRAAEHWSHISHQVAALLRDAIASDGPLDTPADQAARKRGKTGTGQ